ncbi:arabinogalactan peptide 20-like [Tripterygium wilfordii]|uniref:Arabinogalactan peptide 20-like n=1 Tax=Tripterygium wilfordii TaxID=458696 RepID=A0A7J7CJH4_TRIWF|nr:arabinogalactan protein 41-like [Tripterygium wilfordii]KAF5734208.1 arabinogalactan peptide 20-like [Tripterygium wilfordii]
MAVSKVSVGVVAVAALFLAIVLPAAQAQSFSPAPSPTSDGTSVDQGIAYVLMLVALVLTYLIHAADFCHF